MEGVGTMSKIEYRFKTQYELIELLSKSIAGKIKKAIHNKGKATLIVSGGSTPIPLFKRLSEMLLGWEHVTVGLCDERWIPASHEESNENMVKRYLLQGEAAKAKFIGMYVEDTDIEDAETFCETKIQNALFPIDVIILGMGNDAHTASLFPENDKLEEAYDLDSDKLCIAIKPTTAPFDRMSLTLGAILSANSIYVHFEGEEKIAVYKKALGGSDTYKMPIRAVLNQEKKDIEVYYR